MIDDHDPIVEKEADYQAAIADVEILRYGDDLCYFADLLVSDHLLDKIERLAGGCY